MGTVNLKSLGDNRYEILDDYYDFDLKWEQGLSERNIATFFAGLIHGPVIDNIPIPIPIPPAGIVFGPSSFLGGGKFTIKFHGKIKFKK